MCAIDSTTFLLLGLVLSLQATSLASGLTCYECGSGSSPAEGECSSSVGRASVCDKTYCTIYRREYVDPPGKIQYFYRTCESSPAYLNTLVETPEYRTYYSACEQSFCNAGDGLVSLAIDSLEIQNSSDARIYVVPGVGSPGLRPSLARILDVVLGMVVVAAVAS